MELERKILKPNVQIMGYYLPYENWMGIYLLSQYGKNYLYFCRTGNKIVNIGITDTIPSYIVGPEVMQEAINMIKI